MPTVDRVNEATATIVADGQGRHRVELGGAFGHPHWLAFLCGGLSASGVSVVSGHAYRRTPLHWEGSFLVEGPVAGLDVVRLAADRPSARDAGTPVLSSYAATRRKDDDLELHVEAIDALGFLGQLLRRLSLLTLLPVELEIATVGGRISDRFVLSGIGSSSPSDEVLVAMTSMLDKMTL